MPEGLLAPISCSVRRCCHREIPRRGATKGQGFAPVLAPDPTNGYGSAGELSVLWEKNLHVQGSPHPAELCSPSHPPSHPAHGDRVVYCWCSGYWIYYLVAARGSLTPLVPPPVFFTTLLPSQGHPCSPPVPAPALGHPPRTYSAGVCVPAPRTQTSSCPLTRRAQTLTGNRKHTAAARGE